MKLYVLFYHQTLSFECTNLAGLEQINALAQLSYPLHSLTVSPWGNPITYHTFFLPYTIFRLHHLGLSKVNGTTVSREDVAAAEGLFGRLGEITTSQLPRARLLALISKHRSIRVQKFKLMHITVNTKT